MKVKNTLLGILIIAFAIFGILEVSGAIPPLAHIAGGITYVKIIAGVVLTALFVESLCKRRFCTALFMLAFIFMIFERNIAYIFALNTTNIINNWLLLLFTAIICIGLKLIFPQKFKFIHRIHPYQHLHKHLHQSASHSASTRYKENNLTSSEEYIDCTTFTSRNFENNLGQTIIHFENVSEYVGEGKIYIENNLGNTVINVPRDWRVVTEIENNLGSVKNSGGTGTSGPVLYICGENNLGAIEIKKV